MPEPPAEVPPGEEQGGRQRAREPDDADRDHEIARPAGEAERAQGSPEEQREECHAGKEHGQRERAAGLGDRGHETRLEQGGDAEGQDEHDPDDEEREERPDGRGPAQRRDDAEREDGRSDGEGRAAGERDDAVHPDEDTWRREPVQAQKRGHHAERAAHQDGVSVALAGTGDRQRKGGARRHAGTERNDCEVDPAVDRDGVLADEVQQCDGDHRGERGEAEHRDPAVHHP